MKHSFLTFAALLGLSLASYAQAAKPGVETIISDQPPGEVHDLYRTTKSWELFWGLIPQVANVDGALARTVFAEDCIYMLNPISTYFTDTWVKADKQADGSYAVHTPQAVFNTDGGIIYLTKVKNTGTNEEPSFVSADGEDITFSWDGTTLAMTSDGIMGLTLEDGTPMVYGDYEQVSVLLAEKPAAPAESATMMNFSLNYIDGSASADVSRIIDVAIEGTDVYLGNLPGIQNGLWAKGTIDGGKILLPLGQYLGADDNLDAHVYLTTASGPDAADFISDGNIELTFTDEKMSFSAQEDVVLNRGKNKFNYVTYMTKPSGSVFYDVPARPATPTFEDFGDEYYKIGYGGNYIDFFMKTTDVDGNFIDPAKLYYNLFFDDEKYVLTSEYYGDDLPAENITDIPYGFQNASYTISTYKNGTEQWIQWAAREYTTLKVQAVYYGGGVETRSSFLVVDRATGKHDVVSGIENVSAADGIVTSTVYTDLYGRRVSSDTKGFCIKVETMSNGEIKSTKILKR